MHDKRAEELIIAKVREIRGVKSVQSNVKVEERK
jgi:hypothetical protein